MRSIRLFVICKPSPAFPVVPGSAVVRYKNEAKKTIVLQSRLTSIPS